MPDGSSSDGMLPARPARYSPEHLARGEDVVDQRNFDLMRRAFEEIRNAHMVELQCTLCVANNDPNATRFKSISKVPPMPPKSDSRNDLVWLCDDCKFLCECVATEATLSMGEVVEMMMGEAATGYQTGEGLVALFASMLKARQERETSARQPQPQSDSDGTGMPGLVDADPWGKDRPEYSDGW